MKIHLSAINQRLLLNGQERVPNVSSTVDVAADIGKSLLNLNWLPLAHMNTTLPEVSSSTPLLTVMHVFMCLRKTRFYLLAKGDVACSLPQAIFWTFSGPFLALSCPHVVLSLLGLMIWICAGRSPAPLADVERYQVEDLIQMGVKNLELFQTALTAPSAITKDRTIAASFDRLEYLGDAAVALVFRKWVYDRYAHCLISNIG